MTPLYSVENLVFSYNSSGTDLGSGKDLGSGQNGQEILNIPELSIPRGKTYVLLGPNGSGKTTLLKLLNRLLSPTAGTIRFLGADIRSGTTVRSKTVYVHQTPLLFSGTVQSNVAYGLKLRNYPHKEIETRVLHTLKVVGLEGFEKRKSSSLSGGETQRVAIARALTVEPEVLLLDEPTSSIDKKNTGKIEELLTSIRRDYGCSIIISTHNMPFAYRMCDTLIKLEEGKMVPPGENIIPGGVVSGESKSGGIPAASGYRIFRSGGVDIFCPDLEGDFTKAVVDYDRILLSREPLHSSAQNSFRGLVESMVPADAHGLVDVSVRIGDLLLTSRITEKSLRELSISEGSEICLAFKASSVRLY